MARKPASGEASSGAPAQEDAAAGGPDGLAGVRPGRQPASARRAGLLALWGLFLLPVAGLLGLAMLVAGLVEQDAVEEGELRARERLSLYRETVLRELEKFRYLPHVLARDPRAAGVIDDPALMLESSRFLKDMAATTGADALFVMNEEGLTLAASNYDSLGSFVGRNYAFRPYFRAALDDELGQFYAVGATTGKPGFFFSRATPPGEGPRGVFVVKVDLAGLQQSWRDAGETVFLADRHGVIFLGTRRDWLYSSLEPLSDMVVAAIRSNRQYGGVPLPSLQDGPAEADVLFLDGKSWRHDQLRVGVLGWTVHYLTPEAQLHAGRDIVWLSAVALVLLYALVFMLVRSRALGRATRRLQRHAADLRSLNRQLSAEVEERRRVERELREAQAGLARASRLAAVGEMSAAVAHELNQPLAALGMFVSGARLFEERGDVQGLRDNLDEIDALRHRMASLTQELKRFARPGESRIEQVDLRECLKTSAKLLRPRVEETETSLALRLPSRPVVVSTAPLRVEQVLVNLLRNAVDACQQAAEPRVEGVLSLEDGLAVIRISDNGFGVPEDLRERIFEPFFSTKPASGGLGLGLAISARIVEDLGGTLTIGTGGDGGACFVLGLPLEAEPAGDGNGGERIARDRVPVA
jgi:two-component system C4-dicarboxylate transport sensor histidine kinase DctB